MAGGGRAFADGLLSGDRIARLVYIDEAGTSSSDPVSVVAGVVIDADHQWRVVESQLEVLVQELFPGIDDPRKIVFHAKDIFHGSGIFDRRRWSREKRLEILGRLLGIPLESDLPVVVGFYRKGDDIKNLPLPPAVLAQVMAHCMCVLAAERYMREKTLETDVAIMIAENNDQARQHVKRTHNALADPAMKFDMPTVPPDFLPIKRIVDTVHFAEKSEAIMLQIADSCAFTMSRFLAERSYGDDLIGALAVGAGFDEEIMRSPAGNIVMTKQYELGRILRSLRDSGSQ